MPRSGAHPDTGLVIFGLFAGNEGRGTLTVVFNGVGWAEVAVLLVIGLFVFGPERLPKVARDAGRLLRQLRQAATGIRNDLRSELGPELADLDIRDLHPKTFVRKHLFEADDDPLPSYLNRRTSLDALLADDGPSRPSLTKNRVPGATANTSSSPVSLGKKGPAPDRSALDKSSATLSTGGQATRPDQMPEQREEPRPAPSVPFDAEAT